MKACWSVSGATGDGPGVALSPGVPALPPGAELKYVVSPEAAPIALRLLRALCLPDPHHPCGTVCTVYYDTPRGDRYAEKLNSDYLKSKVRARWYLPDADPSGGSRIVFFEIKEKEGARRNKLRRERRVGCDWWDDAPFTDPRFAQEVCAAFADCLPESHGLCAVVEIRYERHRFVERTTGARVALDTCIRANRANGVLLQRPQLPELTLAVLEVKGTAQDLPRSLLPVVSCGFRRESFSKYAQCVEALQPKECGAGWM